MIFDKEHKVEITQFFKNCLNKENFDFLMNSLAAYYYFNTNNNDKNYHKIKELFESLNRFPRLDNNWNIYWVKKKEKKDIKKENPFFKKRNFLKESNEKNFIKDIFWDFENEIKNIFVNI